MGSAEQTALLLKQMDRIAGTGNVLALDLTHGNLARSVSTEYTHVGTDAAGNELYSTPNMPLGAHAFRLSTNRQSGKLVKVYLYSAGSRPAVASGASSAATHSRRTRARSSRSQSSEATQADTTANTQLMRRTVSSSTPERPLWLGPYSDCPPYLDGSLVGDYGWDSSGLSSTPELLSSFSGVSLGESVWFNAGSQLLSSSGLDYLGNPALIHAQSILAVLFLQTLLIALAEGYRVAGGPLGDEQGLYPGNSLDPLGFGEDSSTLSELQLKELKNGRLAMVSILGMYSQALTTGKGPVANWQEHIANPTTSNGFAYATKFAPTLLG